MSNDPTPADESAATAAANETASLAAAILFQLREELAHSRDGNARQHLLFEQMLATCRQELKSSFHSFAADTYQAYQQLRRDIQGEKRISLALFNEILEIGIDLRRIIAVRPSIDDRDAVAGWMEAIAVESRKVDEILARLGVNSYDAVIGELYNPALHERVGSVRVEGMAPYHVADQREPGYASQQPEFILRRPKVVVSE